MVFKLKKAEVDKAPEVKEEPKVEEEVKEKTKEEPQKEVTAEEVLMNHENRLIQMEAKWFRLGGI